MANLVFDCPHCGARSAAFALTHTFRLPRCDAVFNGFSSCPVCFFPVSFRIDTRIAGRQDPIQMQGNLADVFGVEISHIFPARPTSKCPEHVPEAATRAFIEGADNLADGRYTSAVAMFRRVIDVGTKALNTDVTAWQLHRRIDKFADEGLLTSDMRDWAHKIRLDGNDALHEFEEPEKEAAEELKLFTEMMLTYMFTLPAKVKASMQRSEG